MVVATDASAGPHGVTLHAVAFADALRHDGLAVPLAGTLSYASALGELGRDSGIGRIDAYWAGRATLVHRPDDIAVYDSVFARFFGDGAPRSALPPGMVIQRVVEVGFDDTGEADGDANGDNGDNGPADGSADDGAGSVDAIAESDRTVGSSAQEVLRHRDFAELSTAELEELWSVIGLLRVVGSHRRSARHVRARRGDRLDLRRTVQVAARNGGEVIELRRRAAGTRRRPLVLLLDVSGSMEPYSRALLRFGHASVIAGGRVEVFALGTRLTRLTRQLSTGDPTHSLVRAAAAVPDWSGGTRLGDGLAAFLDEWGQRGTARGATVVILSDGWDRGTPDLLAGQMARLRRLAHRIIWVNPL